ncbi:MAG: FAD-dependent oxidoreductase [Nanoarchaeota archaeon]|nr:FAD-dependent oxidoreductase [Nanoarchaeota archaeon]MBU4124488.1 FAD-dependent oxidoreductase [Nanoarchaeota archaeon]
MDLVIVGAGPAGLTAGIYAKLFGLDAVILNNQEQPSQVNWAYEINNYPGHVNISGSELLVKMKEHAKKLGVKILNEKVIEIKNNQVTTEENVYQTKAILIASGSEHRKAEIPGEDIFLGRGVSYCAVCDGPIFSGKDVIVYGGGDSAFRYASFLVQIGAKVTLIHRRNEFRASQYNVDQTKKEGVKFILGRTIKKIDGDKMVSKVILDDDTEVNCSGVFIAIGEVPSVEPVKKLGVKTDENNYIIVDEDQATNVPGIYAAGDVTNNKLKQVVTACASGANAVNGISKYLKGEK